MFSKAGSNVGQLTEPKFNLVMTLLSAYPDYIQLWNKQRKHRWTIPTAVLNKALIDIDNEYRQFNGPRKNSFECRDAAV